MKIGRSVKLSALCILSNILFLLSSISFAGDFETASPWKLFIGGLTGYYRGALVYNSTVIDNAPTTLTFINDTYQQGESWGAQAGFRYQFEPNYYLMFGAAVISNSNKAELSLLIITGGAVMSPDNVLNEFRLKYSIDLTTAIGINISDYASVYFKVGASDLSFDQKMTIIVNAAAIGASFQQTFDRNIWGFLIGLGLMRDIGHWVSLFGEFDYYDYGNQRLNKLTNVVGQPLAAGGISIYNQDVNRLRAFTLRVGANVNFSL